MPVKSICAFIYHWMGCFIISSCIFIGTGDWVIDPSQDYDVSMSYGLKLIVDLLLVIVIIPDNIHFKVG